MMSQPKNLPLAELSFVLFFLIPMSVIAMQYTKMALKISKQTGRLGIGVHGSVHRGSGKRTHNHKTIVKMLGMYKLLEAVCIRLIDSFLAAVVIGFFVCWAPFHAQRLLFIYGQDFSYYHELNAWVFYITGILYYFSSTLNPILYNLMSNRYRLAFKEILCGTKSKHKLLRRSSTLRETLRLSHSDHLTRRSSYNSPRNSHKHSLRNPVIEDIILEEDTLQLVRSENFHVNKCHKNYYGSAKRGNETCI